MLGYDKFVAGYFELLVSSLQALHFLRGEKPFEVGLHAHVYAYAIHHGAYLFYGLAQLVELLQTESRQVNPAAICHRSRQCQPRCAVG